jgi:1-acyl-sn-glycerol-3-phosphate acyltransferase
MEAMHNDPERAPASLTTPRGDYRTAPMPVGWFSRALPTAAFYGRVARVVLRCSRMARQGRYGDADWVESSLAVRDAFERVGARITIEGTRHLAQLDGPCVIIGNHMSTAETFLLSSIVRPYLPVTFVVKQALVEYPVFKHIMRSRDPIVVGRVNPREDLKAVLDGGRERLARGVSIIIFPQRTRTVTFDREAFNTIGVKLARRAGVPVLPLALKTDAWSNGRWLKDYGRVRPQREVRFAFGEPLPVDGNERAAHAAVIAFIERHLAEWGLPPAPSP